ncbi:MAG: hypothetical protein HDS07_06045 [Bacteroides sp.]|nr:hypothetical protein [Bacteroides sp.]
MRETIIFILLCFIHGGLYGSEKSFLSKHDGCYNTTIDTTTYSVGDQRIKQTIISIKNTSNNHLWLLLEADTIKTDREIIRDRILSPKPFNGMPLIKLFSEIVTWTNFIPEIYSYLLKIVAPQTTFNIIIISPENTNHNCVISTIRVMTSSTLDNILRGLSSVEPTTKPTYQSDFITIPIGFNEDSEVSLQSTSGSNQ